MADDLPAPLTYGTIVFTASTIDPDGPDAGSSPDMNGASGRIRLRPIVPWVKAPSLTPARTLIAREYSAEVRNGVLLGPDGNPNVDVLASDAPGLVPSPLLWVASYFFDDLNGTAIPDSVFFVPGGGTVDLTTVIDSTSLPGVTIVPGDLNSVIAAIKVLLPDLVDDALADNATVIAAIKDYLKTVDILTGTDPRVPTLGPSDTHLREQYDTSGYLTSYVEQATGATWVKLSDDVKVPATLLTGAVEVNDDPDYLKVWFDSNNFFLGGIRRDSGAFEFARPVIGSVSGGSGGGGGGSGFAPRPIINCIMGQSNGEGREVPFSAELDPIDPRHLQYDWPTGTLKPATVPLSSRQQQTGKSLLSWISDETLRTEPAGTVVISLNAAVGGSGLYATPPQGKWKYDYVGPSDGTYPSLYPDAKAALLATIALVTAQYGVAPIVRLFWHQGEADNATSQATYEAYFQNLFGDLRGSHALLANAPIVLGGMVLEYNTPGTLDNIRAAHVNLRRSMTRTAHALAEPNAGSNVNGMGLVHIAREGGEKLARKMYKQLQIALMNVTGTYAVPPQNFTARRVAGTLTMSWDMPYCRTTGFVPQYRVNGGAWITPAFATVDTTCVVTGVSTNPADLIECQVATVNDTGTSATTATIGA